MSMMIHECDVLKKIDLIASTEFALPNATFNKFTVEWDLSSYQQYKNNKMYLVLEPSTQIIPAVINTVTIGSIVLVASKGLSLDRNFRQGQPDLITYFRCPQLATDDDYGGFVPAVTHPVVMKLRELPEKEVTFEILENTKVRTNTTTGNNNTQIFTEVDLVFSLYIMKN